MLIRPVTDPAFNRYGKVVEGICTCELMKAMEETPAPTDGVDYKKIMDTLKSINYQGGISVEAFPKDPATDARIALEVLRQAMA